MVKSGMDINAPLTSDELRQLDHLMEVQGGMRLSKLHGYLTAVISGPKFLHPDDWLPKVWDGKESVLQHPQFSISMDGVRRLYNTIRGQLEEEQPFYPLLFYEETLSQVLSEKAALVQWCQGYQEGAEITADIWNLPEHKEIHLLLLSIFITGSDEIKESLSSFTKKETVEVFQRASLKELPGIISAITAYWTSKGRQFYTIGIAGHRLCPCGSGKDVELCCNQRILH